MTNTRRYLCLAIAATLLLPAVCQAFYEDFEGDCTLDARAYLRLLATYSRNPAVDAIYPEKSTATATAVGRLLLSGGLGRYVGWEFNGYQIADGTTAQAVPGGDLFSQTADVVASPSYRWEKAGYQWFDENGVSAWMEVDRLALSIHADPVAISIGRQPINLSTTLLWTPNDLFQPFSAQAFNTTFKPGVDAARLDFRIGMQSGVTLMGVLGYVPDEHADGPGWDESAAIARAYAVLGGFEWSVFGGKAARKWIAAGAFQGELGPLGVRAEGHAAFPIQNPDVPDSQELTEPYGMIAAGIDHRWENTVHLMGEYLYHGTGETSPERYAKILSNRYDPDDPYLGRHYAAVSLAYEPHPLVDLTLLAMANVVDPSGAATAYITYSLSDDAEFVGGAFVPLGELPKAEIPFPQFPTLVVPTIESEYGLYPTTFFMETRFYF